MLTISELAAESTGQNQNVSFSISWIQRRALIALFNCPIEFKLENVIPVAVGYNFECVAILKLVPESLFAYFNYDDILLF